MAQTTDNKMEEMMKKEIAKHKGLIESKKKLQKQFHEGDLILAIKIMKEGETKETNEMIEYTNLRKQEVSIYIKYSKVMILFFNIMLKAKENPNNLPLFLKTIERQNEVVQEIMENQYELATCDYNIKQGITTDSEYKKIVENFSEEANNWKYVGEKIMENLGYIKK